MNLAVIVGRLAHPLEYRVDATGAPWASFELVVTTREGRHEVVPVSWPAPPAAPPEPGVELLVCGRVRHRFFRSAGATRARTDVLAEAVVPTRQRRKAALQLQQVVAGLDAL